MVVNTYGEYIRSWNEDTYYTGKHWNDESYYTPKSWREDTIKDYDTIERITKSRDLRGR